MRRPLLAAAALLAFVAVVAVVPVVTAARPAVAQQPAGPTRLPAPRVELRAAPEDRDTFVPPPIRISGVDGADAPPAPSANIQITYAAGFPSQAKPAVQAALNIWGSLIASSQPITVHAAYHSLGLGTLATANPSYFFRDFDNAPVANTFYAQPLAEALSGQNLGEGDDDVLIDVNTRGDWYFGTDGNTPSGQYDLMTTILHEFLHGLGLLGTMSVSGGQGSWGLDVPPRPAIYDRFVETSAGTKLINTSALPNPSSALRNALQSGALYFDSPQTNRGQSDRVVIYAPNPWEAGSSYAHLDENTYPAGSANSLGTPALNASEAVHNPGPLALCILEAMGWSTTENCAPPPSTQVTGFTWYSEGGYTGSGPTGTTIRAYATGARAGRSYKLISGLDGGPDKPCMWDVVPINPNVRVASSSGLIGTTGGVLNRGPGEWQICFREEGTGSTLQVSAPAYFRIL